MFLVGRFQLFLKKKIDVRNVTNWPKCCRVYFSSTDPFCVQRLHQSVTPLCTRLGNSIEAGFQVQTSSSQISADLHRDGFIGQIQELSGFFHVLGQTTGQSGQLGLQGLKEQESIMK